MRIDKLLWHLRFVKSRTLAQSLIEAGHVRLNGRRVERSHTPVALGSVITLPVPQGVRVVEILALPERRGPAAAAQSCYRVLDVGAILPIAGAGHEQERQGEEPQ